MNGSTAPLNGSATLADLRPGQRGKVRGFLALNRTVQRMMHLGLLRGREIEVVRRAPAGDPIEIRLLGSSLSLRRDDAGLIEVDRL